MRLLIVVGARPNLVKVGPLLPHLQRAGISYDVAFTGSREAERQGTLYSSGHAAELTFFGVPFPTPRWFLDAGAATDGVQTGKALIALEELFAAECPDAVLAVGDVNPTLAAAIAAAKLHLPLVHLEAGLRCGDMTVPEEVNRVLISHIASLHLTSTEESMENLEAEGVSTDRIHFVGNMMAESVLRHMDDIARLDSLPKYGVEAGMYVLASFHRPENLRSQERFANIVAGLGYLGLSVVLPDTNGFSSAMEEWGIDAPPALMVSERVGYLEMLALQRDAAVVVTDSGGVQEESCTIGTPCVTVRPTTEHTATIKVGANRLCEADPRAISACVAEAREAKRAWVTPKRWDRAVSERIVRILRRGVTPLT